MKRKFYIIQHNPNFVGDAINALSSGANAIEPDIVWDTSDSKFEVYDLDTGKPKHPAPPTLADYCSDLAIALLNNSTLNLALIVWDLKNVENSNFDFWKIRDIIKTNFIDKLNIN